MGDVDGFTVGVVVGTALFGSDDGETLGATELNVEGKFDAFGE